MKLSIHSQAVSLGPLAATATAALLAAYFIRRRKQSKHPKPLVLIVGGGAGSTAAVHSLRKRGFRFIVVERNSSLGGTWFLNRYPGCACDIPATTYSFSFATNSSPTARWIPHNELYEYFCRCAADEGISEAAGTLRLNTSVNSMEWDEQKQMWTVSMTTGADKCVSSLQVNAVVLATGQLSTPRIPIDTSAYKGDILHTARWPDGGLDRLKDKTVTVVGVGSSGVQVIPEIAKVAKHVTIIQRSIAHMVPRGNKPYGPFLRFVFRWVPGTVWLVRLMAYFEFDTRAPLLNAPGHSRLGDFLRKNVFLPLTFNYRKHILGNRPDLMEATTPDADPLCKRPLISDDYFPTLLRDNVTLVRAQAQRATADGLILAPLASTTTPTSASAASDTLTLDGQDAIVFATGYESHEFYTGIRVVGRQGTTLQQQMSADDGLPLIHLGITFPAMPNLFCLYGPYTNLAHSHILFMIECQSEYIARLLSHMHNQGHHSATVRESTARAFSSEMQLRLSQSIWSGSCTSWYKSAALRGRIINNWCASTTEYWWRLLRASFTNDFTFA